MAWKIEISDTAGKKVEFEYDISGTVKVILQERDVTVNELSRIWDFVKTMTDAGYIKMEGKKV